MRCAFIAAHRREWKVAMQARVLGVSRSRFYQWERQPTSARVARDAELDSKIRIVFATNKQRYGSPRICDELRAEGEPVSGKRVARLMRSAGLRAKRARRYRATTQQDPTVAPAPRLVDRPFQVASPDQVWGADMTALATGEGWLYLAVILDLCSRRVIGWSFGEHVDQQLALRALVMAIGARRPRPGVIHHSDRGSPYTSHAYRAALAQQGLRSSMSRTGNCWDNAMVESFFATMKGEVNRETWPTRAAARTELIEYMEDWYNRQRRHSALGSQSPIAFEHQRANAA
jgi:putative transposase